MSKIKQRRVMKAKAIAKFIVEQNFTLLNKPWYMQVMSQALIKDRALSMNNTPAELFRHDKPEIDIRRWRKQQRKQGGYVVRVMAGDNELKEFNQKVSINIANSLGVEAKLL